MIASPDDPVQAYVRSHLSTAMYLADFLKHARARGNEVDIVEAHIGALSRLHTQVTGPGLPGCRTHPGWPGLHS
jgi:hypothetical protein